MSNKYLYIVLFCLLLSTGCANRGVGPQGGPKDTIPPIPVVSEPEVGAVNFSGRRIEVTFNEYIQLDNVASNLLMSPPQATPPEVKARGKKLIVQFKDSLHDSTTYTIDFGNAVCDYREKVPLKGYSFYFSTGDEIDTLETVGRVYEASSLNPMEGILVGIHRNLADSAVVRIPFLRIAKTNSDGYFRIGNIHPGMYRMYAVDDISRDYRLTLGETMGFADSLLLVSAADSIPKSSSLLLFKEVQDRLYLQRVLRDKQHMVQLLFSAPQDSVPSFRALRPSEMDSTKSDSAWIDPMQYTYIHYSVHRDTVTLWLTDSIAIRMDSLFLEARYRRTDSLYRLEWYTDTLRAMWRAPKLTAKVLEAQARENRNRRLELKSNARKGFDIYDTLWLACATPMARIDTAALHVYERVDTMLKAMPFSLLPGDSITQKIVFLAEWEPGHDYELHIDSAALHDIYGTTHIAGHYAFELKTLSDYSTLRIKLVPFEPEARIQLLNSKDQVLRELPATEDGANFEYLKPDSYYVRLYLDRNGDGKWTSGAWKEKRQPEPIYYYPEKIQTKSNWDFEQEWDYKAVEQLKSKPKELIKPVTKKK